MNRLVFLFIALLVLGLLEIYAFQAVRTSAQGLSAFWRNTVYTLYWGTTLVLLAGVFWSASASGESLGMYQLRTIFATLLFTSLLAKIFVSLFVLTDDLRRAVLWVFEQFKPAPAPAATPSVAENTLTRSEFLAKAGLIAGTLPIAVVGWGVLKGAHDYQIRRKKVYVKGLPKALEGVTIAQLSDIHSGSFWDPRAVSDGVDQLMAEKPDLVLFTGDLVNNTAKEMKDFGGIFSKVKAPLGVVSVLGNHDYGDYVQWSSEEAKKKNLQDLCDVHAQMGWNLLRNESKAIDIDGARLGLIGVENWSAKGRFPKHGDLKAAYEHLGDADAKILLSHDPSHWRAQVLGQYPDISLTLSGHTHGMQFGIDSELFRWSPVQYMYPEWADLYKEGDQHLYVNRGFGYIGFPGRVGIRPEITLIELARA
jgi:hypothetical protein